MRKELTALVLSVGMFASVELPQQSSPYLNNSGLSDNIFYGNSFQNNKNILTGDFYDNFKLEKEEFSFKDSLDKTIFDYYNDLMAEPKNKLFLPRKLIKRKISEIYGKINSFEVMTPELFEKFVEKESSFNLYAYNSKSKASGLVQIQKPSWEQIFPEEDYYSGRFNLDLNLEAGLRYCSWLENYFGKNNPNWSSLNYEQKVEQLVAGYNAGIGKIRKVNWDFSKMPVETKKYKEFVLDLDKK